MHSLLGVNLTKETEEKLELLDRREQCGLYGDTRCLRY